MTTTEHLGLTKDAESGELYSVARVNANSDRIDAYCYQTRQNTLNNAAAITALDDKKQDLLSFDTAPIQNSTNPVTSGGVYTAISAEAVSREAADSAMVTLEAADRAALAELIDSGTKNLLKITATSTTLGGVDYTPDNSGGISINGTATVTTNAFVIGTFTPTVTGDYAVVFFRSNYSNDYRMQLRDGSASNAPLVASVIDTSTISLAKGTEYTIRIYVANGTVIDDVAYPMICTAAAYKISPAYVPHRPSYDELIARIEALEGGAG